MTPVLFEGHMHTHTNHNYFHIIPMLKNKLTVLGYSNSLGNCNITGAQTPFCSLSGLPLSG